MKNCKKQLGKAFVLLVGLIIVWFVSAPSIATAMKKDQIRAFELHINYYDADDLRFVSTGACGGSGGSISLVGGDNIEKAYRYFVSRGLSEKQSAGIVGNFMVETHGDLDPKTNQDGGGVGRGIAQWSVGGRWDSLKKWAGQRDIYDLGTQLDYVWHEMNSVSPWSKTLPAIKKATTIREATDVFMRLYEKPGVPNFSQRLASANDTYGKFAASPGGGGGGQVTPTTGCSGASGGSIVSIAQGELDKGVLEQPIGCDHGNPSKKGDCGTEVNKYTDNTLEYWCADFVSWVYKQAGTPFTGGASGGWRIASVSGLRAWFQNNGEYTKNGSGVTPKPGDVYITAGEEHAGIVVSVDGGKIHTISGNTSAGNYSNGVGVGSAVYSVGSSRIAGFGSL